ncbi:MAG: phosphatidylserine/phosphatidylglycerophosphate/cardiolipin synthase family protein [Candidatus Magasanikbacteria bacterium]|jgi:cardiolipin synthase
MPSDFSYKFYRDTVSALRAMQEAILGAQKSIYWEIYSLIDDKTGKPFVDALCERALAGLEIKIIIDAIGSYEISQPSLNRLRTAGVDIVFYNSFGPRWSASGWARSLWQRNHRKVLVIDKEAVFIGGVNVAESYCSWDDLHVRITGMEVSPLLRGFARSYIRGGGERKKVRHLLYFHFKKEWNEIKGHLKYILQSPLTNRYSRAKRIFLTTLSKAKLNFNLLTPYFVPDKRFFELVSLAKKRGVKIDLFLPLRPDHKFIELVGGFYSKMAHKYGMNVFFSPKMNHGKAMTCDGEIGFVGSVNFTQRSFFNNEESGILFRDSAMVKDLDDMFADLRASAFVLNDKNYLHFGLKGKIKDWLGKQFGGWI